MAGEGKSDTRGCYFRWLGGQRGLLISKDRDKDIGEEKEEEERFMESFHFMFAYMGEGGPAGSYLLQQDVLLHVRSGEEEELEGSEEWELGNREEEEEEGRLGF